LEEEEEIDGDDQQETTNMNEKQANIIDILQTNEEDEQQETNMNELDEQTQALKKTITRFESKLMAKKDWTMSGEVSRY
jgi:U3 small nucleolar ribonucleoprotein component